MHRLILLTAGLLVAVPATARSQSLPPVATTGLDLVVQGQSDSAIQLWGKSWPDPNTAAKRDQMAVTFRGLPSMIGAFVGYDVIKVVDITPHLKRAYVMLRGAREPVYLLLTLYMATDTWVVLTVALQADLDRLISPNSLGAQSPAP